MHARRLGARWFLIKTGRGADRAMDVANLLFAVSFIVTRIVIYAMGLVQLIWDLFLSGPAGDQEGQVLESLPQCGTRLMREEQEHELEQFQTETAKEHDASLFGCERAQQMIYGVVALLVAGQVLNLIWASQIVRMARKTKHKGGGEKEHKEKSA